MFVYSRNRVPNVNDEPAVAAAAPALAAAASEVTGRPVSAFRQMFGPSVGTVSWSTVVNDMVDLGDLNAKLAADGSFQDKVNEVRPLFATVADDMLVQIVANSIEKSDNAYYATTRATGLPGKGAEMMAFGHEVQEHYANAGFAALFGIAAYGPVSGVGFMVAADTLAELDALNKFRSTDSKAIELLAKAGGIFVAGSGEAALLARLD